MKTIQFANLKHSYNGLPCGSKFVIGGKHTENNEVLLMAYSSLRCTKESFLGYFPKSIIQIIGTHKV